jgi:hypothetical protein
MSSFAVKTTPGGKLYHERFPRRRRAEQFVRLAALKARLASPWRRQPPPAAAAKEPAAGRPPPGRGLTYYGGEAVGLRWVRSAASPTVGYYTHKKSRVLPYAVPVVCC